MMTGHSTPPYPGVLPPPPGVTADIHFKQSRLNLLTQIACIVVTTIFVFLRIYSKHVTSLRFHTDDWVSLGAWGACIVYYGLCLLTGSLGTGKHMWNVTPDKFMKNFQVGYVLEVLYGPVIYLAKLAILILLKRIFSIKKRFVVAIKILIGVLTVYYIAITLLKVFICKPIEKFWNHDAPGSCLNINTVFISDCVISLVTDLVILVSPLPVIWGLQMDLRRKLGSSVGLVVGSIACIASILRLEASIRTMDDPDKSYIFEPILLYSSAEIAIGVICGCIPVLPALYRHYKKEHNQYHWNSTQSYGSGKDGMSRKSYKGMVPLQELPSVDSVARKSNTTDADV